MKERILEKPIMTRSLLEKETSLAPPAFGRR
jgi:hypothetical protein